MACYRNGGCGPYDMLSCGECPASKPEYLRRYDVVKVVRCKDCAEWQKDWEPSSAPKGTHFCAIVGLMTDPEWFCADGNRLGE